MIDAGMLNTKKCHIHLMGIGGAGMSALAYLLLEKGHKVSGCDMSCSTYLKKMLKQGVSVEMGHSQDHLKGQNVDLLIYSSAISRENPELLYAQEKGIAVAKRAEVLSQLFNGSIGIGIAGAHGKTTTSSMVAFLLECANFLPSVAIGGELCDIGGNAKLGASEYMVAELDESDGSFELFSCSLGIVTNIDWDHVDHYPDMHSVTEGFFRFMQHAKEGSSFMLCTADEGVRGFLDSYEIPSRVNVSTYGWDPSCDCQAFDLQHVEGGGVSFSVRSRKKELGRIALQLSGEHNVLNALAACSVGLSLDIPFDIISQALHDFTGAKRRLQRVGSFQNALVYDDYGHHPREIRATLHTLRKIFPERRLVVAFQPHRYSRTAAMYKDFADALSLGDYIFLLPIYSADEKNTWNISSRHIFDVMKTKGTSCVLCSSMEDALRKTLQTLGENDLFLTLGAGNINDLGEHVVSSCSEKGTYAEHPVFAESI